MRDHGGLWTIRISAADLQVIRESLLLALQRVPARHKGDPRWLAIDRAYDNLVDAIVIAQEERDAKA